MSFLVSRKTPKCVLHLRKIRGSGCTLFMLWNVLLRRFYPCISFSVSVSLWSSAGGQCFVVAAWPQALSFLIRQGRICGCHPHDNVERTQDHAIGQLLLYTLIELEIALMFWSSNILQYFQPTWESLLTQLWASSPSYIVLCPCWDDLFHAFGKRPGRSWASTCSFPAPFPLIL